MFYVNNLDVRQSRQANDSASIAKRAKEIYPRDPQVHRTLFRAKSLKGGELSNFLGDLSVDDVFRIAIVQ